MLDYIKIKSTDESWGEAVVSTDLTGFLVASLPPITRPAMRNQIEEIDGRAGDIITELGYAAYDKPLGIAMYGDYDYQKILDYFKSKGQVIFSNEPDKYYDYQILDMIALERVIKFKRGLVSFHVQPYKHYVDEESITLTVAGVVTNIGNVDAKPVIEISGSGTVDLVINGINVLTVNLGNNNTSITIDTERLEAYSGTVLKNRQVLGNYENVLLQIGDNTIEWTGNVTSVTINKYSRWI